MLACHILNSQVFECRTVRSSAALALGKLSALSTRVDPLVSDLLSSLQVILSILSLFGPFTLQSDDID